jgi:MscS family membrane protein
MIDLSVLQKLPLSQKFVWFLGISLGGWVLTQLILFIWEKLILPSVSKTESSLDDHLAKNVHKPITRLSILGSIYLASVLTIASAPELKLFIDGIEQILYLVLILLIANLIDAILKSFVDWYLKDIATKTESALDDTLFPVLRTAGKVVIYFIAMTVILSQFKINLAGFLATAGVASLAIAFAAQETLSNVISGISLLLDRSFHIGERIELKDGLVGDVVEIGLRSVKILSPDNRLIIVPNKDIAGSRLINWSQPDTQTKVKLKIGVAMDEDLERVKNVVLDVCARQEGLSKKSPAVVFCTGFGPYFMELLIVATVDDYRDGAKAIDQLTISLQKAFKEQSINLPYPQQHIQLKQLP